LQVGFVVKAAGVLALAAFAVAVIYGARLALTDDPSLAELIPLDYPDLGNRYPKEFRPVQARTFPVQGYRGPDDTHLEDALPTPRSTGEPSSEGRWTLLAVGDLMAHEGIQLTAYQHRNDPGETAGGYDFVFRQLHPLIAGADLAVGNLETPVAASAAKSGFPRFNADPAYVTALKNLGFDVLLTANNHILDQDVQGMQETLREIKKQGLMYSGSSGASSDEEPTRIVELGSQNRLKVGILNYTLHLNGGILDFIKYALLKPQLNISCSGKLRTLVQVSRSHFCLTSQRAFLDAVRNEVDDLGEQGAEYIVMFIHWGLEYHQSPTKAQRQLAAELALHGVDALIGSHPHFIQPHELIYTRDGVVVPRSTPDAREHYVAYSLGNFASHQGGGSKFGEVLELELARVDHRTFLRGVTSHVVKTVPRAEEIVQDGHSRLNISYHLEMSSKEEFRTYIRGGNR
jgi:poly-gamma-glutamate synthesis protein (capsule biosynthesis protein)